MATTPNPQPEQEPQMPVFHSDGQLGLVPLSKYTDTIADPTYEPAIMMTAPDGTQGYVPRSKVRDSQTHGYTVGQFLPKSAGDQIATDANGQKHVVQGANAPTFGSGKNFLLNAAQAIYPSNRGPLDQAEYEAEQLYHHPGDTLAEAFREANPIRWFTNSANTEAQRTADAVKRKDYNAAAVHAVESVIPGIGSQLGDASEQIRSGDVSGGLGRATGTGAQLALGNEDITKPIASATKATARAVLSPRETLTTTIPTAAGKAVGAVRDFAMDPNGAIAAAGQRIFGAKAKPSAPAAEPAVDLGQGEVIPPQNVKGPGEVAPEEVGQPPEGNPDILAGNQGVRVRPQPQIGAGYQPKFKGQLPEQTATQLPDVSDSGIMAMLTGRNIEVTRPGADIRSFLQANKNAPLQVIRKNFFDHFDAGEAPSDMGGVSEPFGVEANRPNRVVLNKRQPGPPDETVIAGAKNLAPNAPIGSLRPLNGWSAALGFLTHVSEPTLDGILAERGIPFVKGGDTAATKIGKILDSLDDNEVREFHDATIEGSRHPSPNPEMRDFNAQQPRSVMGMIAGRADEPAPQLPTDENTADLLQRSIEQANAKKAGAAPAPERTPLQALLGGQLEPDQRGPGRIDPFSPSGIRISTLRGEMAKATDPAERQAFQDAINREIALARGENPPLTQQAEAENLPEKQPRTVEPSEQFPPKAQPGQIAGTQENPVPLSSLQPGQIGWVPPHQVGLDPDTFQFKQGVDTRGIQPDNPIVGQRFDPFLADIVDVFKFPNRTDVPANVRGKGFAAEGHHRTVAAQDSNAPAMLVRVMDTTDPQVARARAALKNISKGNGSLFDMATFLKDSGGNPDVLQQANINPKAPKTAAALAVSKLDDPILRRLGKGEISEGRAIALSKASDPAIQRDVLAEVERRERAGKQVSDLTVGELANLAQQMGTNTQETMSLFGPELRTTSGLMDIADVASHVRREIAKKRSAFGAVSSQARAQMLNEAGNVIDPETNQRISQQAAQALQLFDKEMMRTGNINSILQDSARRLRNGAQAAKVKTEATAAIEKELDKTISTLNGPAVGGSSEGTGQGTGTGKPAAETGQPKTTSRMRPFFGDMDQFKA